MRTLCFLLLSAACCFGQTSGNVITGYQALSLFGYTNALHTNDAIALSIRAGTASERPKAMLIPAFSNLLFSGMATIPNRVTNIETLTNLTGDAFVFAGDSYMGEISFGSGVGYGTEMPTMLLTCSNYSHYLYTRNFGVGGYTTANVSNIYQGTIAPHKPPPGVTTLLFNQTGENLETPSWAMTNFWTNVMMRGRADGFKMVAFTAPTNASGTLLDQLGKNTNNLMVRARSDLYDYLVDYDKLMTNAAVQLQANGHPTVAFNIQVADWINANIVPPHSTRYRQLRSYHSLAPDFLTVKSNLNMQGGINLLGPALYSGGPGGQLSWDGTEVVITSDSTGLGTTFGPAYIQASALNLNKGGLNAFTGGIINGAGGATITNVLAVSATLDFPSTGSMTNSDLSIAYTGGTTNDVAFVQVPPSMQLAASAYTWWVTNGLVWVRFNNYQTNAAQNPPAGLVNAIVFKR